MMIILWNHGNGILDEQKNHDYRGILYNYSNNTFMNNQQLDNALARITATVLGKKLDILGMDACLMAMIEVAYQVKEYAHLLIASENVERAPGWYYAHSLEALNKIQGPISARTIALHITSSFAFFNRHRTSVYTLSTIDLSRMIVLKNSINVLVSALKACHKKKPVETNTLIACARDYALEIEEGNYIDLLSFLNLLKSSLELSQKSKHALFVALKAVLDDCVHNLKEAVIISRIGPGLAGTGGLSIYFPRQGVHHSYAKTKFAQDTDWLSCIQLYQQRKRRA